MTRRDQILEQAEAQIIDFATRTAARRTRSRRHAEPPPVPERTDMQLSEEERRVIDAVLARAEGEKPAATTEALGPPKPLHEMFDDERDAYSREVWAKVLGRR